MTSVGSTWNVTDDTSDPKGRKVLTDAEREAICARARAARAKLASLLGRDVSQETFAERGGTTRLVIHNLEKTAKGHSSYEVLRACAKSLGVTTDDYADYIHGRLDIADLAISLAENATHVSVTLRSSTPRAAAREGPAHRASSRKTESWSPKPGGVEKAGAAEKKNA